MELTHIAEKIQQETMSVIQGCAQEIIDHTREIILIVVDFPNNVRYVNATDAKNQTAITGVHQNGKPIFMAQIDGVCLTELDSGITQIIELIYKLVNKETK